MQDILVYVELHWGKRRPVLEFILNEQQVIPVGVDLNRADTYQENAIYHLRAPLLDRNNFKIIMSDKVDDDQLITDTGEMVHHWVKIRDISIDEINFELCLYRASNFTHTMSEEWVNNLKKQGFDIQPNYPHGTELRLNGVWDINFNTPIWQWCVERTLK
jgi:hypothetical protein